MEEKRVHNVAKATPLAGAFASHKSSKFLLFENGENLKIFYAPS
jgi:hypothetical protein